MNRTGIHGFYETSRDRKQKFANQRHKYSDFGVLLDYWFDERARAEAETEIMLYKMSKNQLGFQKLDKYLVTISRPVELTRNLDGFVHHSDIIRLRWTEISSGRLYFLAALPFSVADDGTFEEPCLATATEDSRIMARSAFHVFRNNNLVPNHIPLTYGECILFCTVDGTGHRLLECEPKSFSTYARKSDHREVKWVKELSSRSLWKILHVDKEKRRMTEGKFVKSNTDVILKNLATGQNLAFEKNTSMNTVLGEEKEVSGHLYLDRFKNEEAENVWQLEAPLMGPEDYGGPIHLPRCETL